LSVFAVIRQCPRNLPLHFPGAGELAARWDLPKKSFEGIGDETEKWGTVVQALNIKAE
jgi:hypothetical protein